MATSLPLILMFAVRSFLNAGIMVNQTSDYPPGPFEPLMAIQSSVTRTDYKGTLWGPKQKVSGTYFIFFLGNG